MNKTGNHGNNRHSHQIPVYCNIGPEKVVITVIIKDNVLLYLYTQHTKYVDSRGVYSFYLSVRPSIC